MPAGRPNKPTELKVLEGNRGKRDLHRRQEPDPDYLDDLNPPAWLPEKAQAVWRELAFKLRKAKVLTVIDVPAFEKLCVAHARWRDLAARVQEEGVMVERVSDKDEKAAKQRVINQLVFAESMAFKQAVTLEREFGMTPSARSRVYIEPQLGLFDHGKNDKGPEQAGAGYFTKAK